MANGTPDMNEVSNSNSKVGTSSTVWQVSLPLFEHYKTCYNKITHKTLHNFLWYILLIIYFSNCEVETSLHRFPKHEFGFGTTYWRKGFPGVSW